MKSCDIDSLIIALRDSRRRHLDARLARDAFLFTEARALQAQEDMNWTVARAAAACTKRGTELERTAADAYHDCEELIWRLRAALGPQQPADAESQES